jgi:acylphosphatase
MHDPGMGAGLSAMDQAADGGCDPEGFERTSGATLIQQRNGRGNTMKRWSVLRVWGRVQGVNYRRAAQREAVRLGITGFARNMPDDSVWIEAEGEEEAMAAFIAWCEKGPPRSVVDRFEVQDGDLVGYKGFEIY